MSPYEEESGTISEDVSLPVVKVTDETPSQVDEVGNMLCISFRTIANSGGYSMVDEYFYKMQFSSNRIVS